MHHEPDGMMALRRLPAWLLGLALAALACAVHAGALEVGFFSDDLTWLARLDATRANPQYLLAIFGRDFTPLFHLSLLADYLVGGTQAWMFHASSILVHAACVALLFALMLRLGAPMPVAAIATATWALNVRISEAVIWPAARCHSLAALFILAALIVLSGRSRRRVAGALLLLTLGLLAKETAIAGVALAPLFLSRDDDQPPGAPRPWRHWLRAWPFVALGVAFLAFNHLAKPGLGLSSAGLSQLILKIPFIALRPIGLGDAYTFTWPAFALVMVLVIALAVVLRRTMARLGFAWILVLSVLVVPLEKVSSRYLYVLAIGHALVLCGLVQHVTARLVTVSARRAIAALGILIVALVLFLNTLLIQREIDDYASLAARYESCLSALRPAAAGLKPGETLVVIDTTRVDAIAAMTRDSFERGGITKLIPPRPWAIGGLVALDDAVNIARAGEGSWAMEGPAPTGAGGEHAPTRVFWYDGVQLRRAKSFRAAFQYKGRPIAVHLVTFDEMRVAEQASGH